MSFGFALAWSLKHHSVIRGAHIIHLYREVVKLIEDSTVVAARFSLNLPQHRGQPVFPLPLVFHWSKTDIARPTFDAPGKLVGYDVVVPIGRPTVPDRMSLGYKPSAFVFGTFIRVTSGCSHRLACWLVNGRRVLGPIVLRHREQKQA
jgi:hypothetical protein